MELITITMTRIAYDSCFDYLPPHEVKLVRVKDELFKDDETHKKLKSIADKAYKAVQDYEFKIRNKI